MTIIGKGLNNAMHLIEPVRRSLKNHKICRTGNEYGWLHTHRTSLNWARYRSTWSSYIRGCWFLPCPYIEHCIPCCSSNWIPGLNLCPARRPSEIYSKQMHATPRSSWIVMDIDTKSMNLFFKKVWRGRKRGFGELFWISGCVFIR
jgi:hypothetical protein